MNVGKILTETKKVQHFDLDGNQYRVSMATDIIRGRDVITFSYKGIRDRYFRKLFVMDAVDFSEVFFHALKFSKEK